MYPKLLTVGGMVTSAAAFNFRGQRLDFNSISDPSTTCNFFKQSYPNMTLLPTDSGYLDENALSWNAGAWLGPACVLTPASAEQLSCAVKSLVKFQTPFAMRGGGQCHRRRREHQLDQLIWGEVYTFLNTTGTGKMVVGGRHAPVGIPGLLLGGGISFFSYDYGFASTNGNMQGVEVLFPSQLFTYVVLTQNCALANSTIIQATPSGTYSDLFWALQEGGNSFCLATKSMLRTFDSSAVGLANPLYGFGDDIKTNWLTSIFNYVQNGSSDGKAAIIPVRRSACIIAFKGEGESHGLNQRFHVISHTATLEAMNIVHDNFFDAVKKYDLGSLDGFFVGLAWNSITTKFIETSKAGIRCPRGVPEEPVFWIEESLTWGSAEDTPLIDDFLATTNANIMAQLEVIDATSAYIYFNDVDETQDVFAGYPAANVERMKTIRDIYDPGYGVYEFDAGRI
ncbi:uncharacterized protein PAC_07554 [Phialocephala subalpina]|uniref:FAD-binding PCMH-type domain-containing protein n=1 Tax=Phialocephala subalpina TaxID=576137 RepID=A0A1L7WY31_9HELO|nr:uncharacterized protein PAC_07554 [Phialocephala subalpina]